MLQLIQQYFILTLNVVSIARHHEEQKGVALDMTEESQAESLPLTGTFDDTRYIGHHETLAVTIADDAQRWFHRRKRIVGNLRLRT